MIEIEIEVLCSSRIKVRNVRQTRSWARYWSEIGPRDIDGQFSGLSFEQLMELGNGIHTLSAYGVQG